jgi:hypothetical protein
MTAAMPALLGLEPKAYEPSVLHGPDRMFRETNCYVDLWIELLHARGIDPASAMAAACMVDFEGDQWTFFKPDSEELRHLFGIDVHEMQLYRPLTDHVVEQLTAGRTMTIEVDSFYLPDTTATSYRSAHVKSSIAVEAIDGAREVLRYFHGAGYYELGGEDYRGVFRLGRGCSEDALPPYVELIRFDAGPRLEDAELRSAVRVVLRRHLARRPKCNPWLAFGDRLSRDLPSLLAGTENAFHAYAFATVRQCGAAFELAASFAEWLAGEQRHDGDRAVELFSRQASGAKTLLFKLARRRPFQPGAEIEQLAGDWHAAMAALETLSLEHYAAGRS